MRVVVVGSGGREHALAWKLAAECEVVATPGNPGIAQVAACLPGSPLEVCRHVRPDLVVVGPENPLIDGLADRLRDEGYATVGPGASGARLEASKAFSKEVMARAGVPTAAFKTFTDPHQAREFARERYEAGRQLAIKASGAALGKGVVVAETLAEALEAIESMMVDLELGEAGSTVVLEDRLVGREFSLLTLCSGTSIRSLPVAQDYKRALDRDLGPNTGGMGTYSPVSWLSDSIVERTVESVVRPALRALADAGIDYRGVLFSGVMVQDGRPFCLEYNVRFGDPETQSVVRRLGSGFPEALRATANGAAIPPIETLDNAVTTVVLASEGYPGNYPKGLPITVGAMPASCVLFHAGTAVEDGQLVTAGGRVMAVSATAPTLEASRAAAYEGVRAVAFDGMHYRTDIGRDTT